MQANPIFSPVKRLHSVLAIVLSAVLLATVTARDVSGLRGDWRFLSLELTPLSNENTVNSTVWDFSGCSPVEERAEAYARRVRNIVYEDIAGRCRAYLIAGDSVYYRGYNQGRHERMIAEGNIPAMAPGGFHAGDSLRAEGMVYDVPSSERGLHSGRRVGVGRLVYFGDTVSGVRLFEEVFSVTKAVGGDSVGVPERFALYRWFCPGDTLPLAVQIESGAGENLSRRLFVDRESLSHAAEKDKQTENESGDEAIMSVLRGAAVEVGPGTISISFPPSPLSAELDISLMDVAGNIYSSVRHILPAEEASTVELPRSSCPRGRYIVAVRLRGNPEINYKIYVDL